MFYDDSVDEAVRKRLQMLAIAEALRRRKVPGVYAQEGPRGFRVGESEDIAHRAVEQRSARRAQLGPGYTTTPLVVEPDKQRRRLYESLLIRWLRDGDPKGSKNPVDH